ncbi:MAG: phage tail tape measure protein [Tissierellaceae bacterium]|nr:phage tail tape measure protein [Tissierellaceae bacterium]
MANNIDLVKYVARIGLDQTDLNKGLDEADGFLKTKVDGMVNWSKVAIAGMVTGVIAGIGVTIKKGIDSFIEFENQMNTVYTLLPDITEDSMGKMEQQVKDLSTAMGVLPNEIIPALYSSLSASVPEENVFAFLEVAQKGAIAGLTETETVVDGLTTVLNSYHMEATQAGKVSDILFNTIKFGKTSMEELSNSMSNVTPVASALGVDFEDIGAALASMTAQGANTATASTQLRQMLLELSKEGTKTSDVFKQVAGVGFKEFISQGHNVNDALALMENYAKETGVEINDLFGSVQGGQAALMLSGESAELFATNIERMGNSAGATQEAFETMDNGIGRSLEKIKVGMSNMILDLGERLSPAFAKVTDYILDAMPTIANVVENAFNIIGNVVKVFVEVVDWLIGNLTEFVSQNEELFTAIYETISTIFNGVIEVINTFVTLFKTIWEKYGKDIADFAKKSFDNVKNIIDGVLKVITGIVKAFTALLTGDWDKFGKALQIIIDGAWKLIKAIFENAINQVSGIMKGAIRILSDIAKSIMEGVWNAFRSIWDSITRWIDNSFSGIARTITNFGRSFYNAGKEIFSSLWDGLKGVWSSISSWVSDKVNWIADKLAFWKKSEKEMDSSSSSSTKSSSNYSNVPRYAVGTPFVPSDQLAFLHKGEAVIPAKYNPYGSGLGGNTVTVSNNYDSLITVHGNVDKDVVKDMEKVALRVLRENEGKELRNQLNKVGIFRTI